MAKSNDGFNIDTLSARQAQDRLSSLRRGRGGRTSRFQPVLEAVQGVRKGQIVTVSNLARKDVQALRSYIYRQLDREEYTVKSAREKNAETYTVLIGRAEDFE